MINKYDIGTIVQMKKVHPCGCDKFKIVRTGVDIKITCEKCSRTIMLDRLSFNKRVKKVLEVQND